MALKINFFLIMTKLTTQVRIFWSYKANFRFTSLYSEELS